MKRTSSHSRKLAASAMAWTVVLWAGSVKATPPSIQVNPSTTIDAEELCVAIDPTNPAVLAAGANTAYFYRSPDTGSTWVESILSSSHGVAGDPCVAFDADGNLYYAHLSFPFTPTGSWLDRIVVQKSTDKGVSWSDGVGVGHNPPKDQDKEWLAADRTLSPHRGNLYLAWTEFDSYASSATSDSTRILFSRSTDQSQTWSSPVRVSDRGGNCVDEDLTVEGAMPAVGPDGQVYMAWAGHDSLWFDRSTDGGVSFAADVKITDQPGGWDFAVPGVWRANGLPVTVCDVSASPYRGRIYVVFSDQRNGVDDTDIFLCTSDDEGQSWTSPQRINPDTGTTHQFFPWASVDPIRGTLAVVYYDRSATVGEATDVTVLVSMDGGASFQPYTVSDASFTPWDTVFFGDYIGIDVYDGTLHTMWMAMDQGALSVWHASMNTVPTATPPADPAIHTSVVMRIPSVATGQRTKISFTTYSDARVDLSIYNLRGRLLRTLVSEPRGAGQHTEMWDGTDRSGSSVASGMYVVRLAAGPDVVTKKVAIVK